MAKDFFGNLGQALSKTAKELSGRAEDVYETQRLKNKISAEERQIDKIMADLGKIVYQHYKEEVPVDDAQKALCEQIDQRMEQIEQLRTDINNLKIRSRRICPSCGKEVEKNAAFCKFCGAACPTQEDEEDAGDVIEISKTPIGENETAGELLDRLAVLGAELLSKTLTRFTQGPVPATPQDPAKVSFAPMLEKTMCPIDWTKTAQQVHDHVRGLHPWPVATMQLQGKLFKVHETRVVPGSGQPGQILGLTKTGLVMACGQGAVEIRSLQAEGGKRMAAPDYFRGHPLEL